MEIVCNPSMKRHLPLSLLECACRQQGPGFEKLGLDSGSHHSAVWLIEDDDL
jgi:hypothetical protein